jgi:hypothetical protein
VPQELGKAGRGRPDTRCPLLDSYKFVGVVRTVAYTLGVNDVDHAGDRVDDYSPDGKAAPTVKNGVAGLQVFYSSA